jgi:hypothetical protein
MAGSSPVIDDFVAARRPARGARDDAVKAGRATRITCFCAWCGRRPVVGGVLGSLDHPEALVLGRPDPQGLDSVNRACAARWRARRRPAMYSIPAMHDSSPTDGRQAGHSGCDGGGLAVAATTGRLAARSGFYGAKPMDRAAHNQQHASNVASTRTLAGRSSQATVARPVSRYRASAKRSAPTRLRWTDRTSRC